MILQALFATLQILRRTLAVVRLSLVWVSFSFQEKQCNYSRTPHSFFAQKTGAANGTCMCRNNSDCTTGKFCLVGAGLCVPSPPPPPPTPPTPPPTPPPVYTNPPVIQPSPEYTPNPALNNLDNNNPSMWGVWIFIICMIVVVCGIVVVVIFCSGSQDDEEERVAFRSRHDRYE